jgi:hypothetical protein
MPNTTSPDLTQRPPRSMRCRLGGFAILPRILDKCRATIAGKHGAYRYNGSMDQHFFRFTGIDAEALKTEVATGKGDGDILDWIQANAKTPRAPWEIQQWSDYHDRRTPDSDNETLLEFAEMVAKFSKTREDIRTWADLLDLDDHCTFGGLA